MLNRTEENEIQYRVRVLRRNYSDDELAEAFVARTLDDSFRQIGRLLASPWSEPHIEVWCGYEKVVGSRYKDMPLVGAGDAPHTTDTAHFS